MKKLHTSSDIAAQNLLAIVGRFCLEKRLPSKSPAIQYVIPNWSSNYQQAVQEVLEVLQKYVIPEEVEDFKRFKQEVLRELASEREEGVIPVYRNNHKRGRR